MSHYVDGFVIPVENDRVEDYREMAAKGGELWIEHGALHYFEGVGDDLEPDMDEMEYTTFPDLADAGSDETVIFSFILYESKEHRDEVNAAVFEEMESREEDYEMEMPFDVAEMAYGGFRALVEYQAELSDEEPIGTTG